AGWRYPAACGYQRRRAGDRPDSGRGGGGSLRFCHPARLGTAGAPADCCTQQWHLPTARLRPRPPRQTRAGRDGAERWGKGDMTVQNQEPRIENREQQPRPEHSLRRPLRSRPFSILNSQFSILPLLMLALGLRLLLWSQPLHQLANDEVEYVSVARELLAG